MKKQHTTLLKNFVLLIFLSTLINSCDRDQDLTGEAIVVFNLQGVESVSASNNASSKSREVGLTTSPSGDLVAEAEEIQRLVIPFDDKYTVEVIVQPEQGLSKSSILRASSLHDLSLEKTAATSTTTSGREYLPIGVKYRIVVYNSSGDYVSDEEYTVQAEGTANATTLTGLMVGQTYTFVVYSIGSTDSVPDAPQGNISSVVTWSPNPDNKFQADLALGNSDFMYRRIDDVNLIAGTNNLDIVLNHLFCEITVTINAYDIVTVADAHIKPHYEKPLITLGETDYGQVVRYHGDWQSPSVLGQLLSFPTLSANSITSSSTIICNPGVESSRSGSDWYHANGAPGTSTLGFASLRINNAVKYNFLVTGLELKPGRKYKLTMNINETGTSLEWSVGNLIYDIDTDTYSFTSTQDTYGSYFFPQYTKPKNRLVNNQQPNMNYSNGSIGDPCSLVVVPNGEGSWRLPTEEELTDLQTATAAQNASHPGPDIYAPARFAGIYDDSESNGGLFFAIQSHPGDNRNFYTFLAYGGAYHDLPGPNSSLPGDSYPSSSLEQAQGYYLYANSKNEAGTRQLQIGNVNTFNRQNASSNTAYQVRCVRNP